MKDNEILSEIENRCINRICHFTKSKNLSHILNDFQGIYAIDFLPESYQDYNDSLRLDGKTDYICCSIEYPNVFYLDRIKNNDKLFKEWIILSIDPKVMCLEETLFSKVNSATEKGRYISKGINGFRSLFEDQIVTSKRSITRTTTMLQSSPTDIQAEVLIYKKIPIKYIKEIIVKSELQAREEFFRMKLWGGKSDIPIIVAPELFESNLSNKLRAGKIPKEHRYSLK